MQKRFYQWFNISPLLKAKSVWIQKTPTVMLPDTQVEQLSRLLSRTLMVILILGVIGEVAYLVANQMRFELSDALTALAFLLLTLAYVVNHRGYFKTAIALTLSVLVFGMYAVFWFNQGDSASIGLLVYLVVPLLLAEFFLSPRAYALVAALILTGMIGSFDEPMVVDRFVFLAIFSTLLGLASFYQQNLEHKRLLTLQESEERFRAAFEQAAVGIAHIAPDGHWLKVNQKLCDIVGYTREELLTKTFQDITHPDDLDTDLSHMSQVVADAFKTYSREKRYFHKDGSIIWINLTASLVRDVPGKPKYFIGVVEDITRRKRAEVALEVERTSLERRVAERTADLNQANADLAYAARLKDEFLSSMSHELRTPLNGILALSESLEEGVYGELTAKQRDPLHTIAESGYILLSLINDILDVAKIEASKLELQLEQVNIERVCQASLRLVKEPAKTKHLQVAFLSNHTMTTVKADERRLKQMIVNLLSNAIKFTPAGGRIGLDVIGDPENQTIRFMVWDTGIGIPAEKLGLLFQTFTQLDSSLARQYNGTGLGLALVKRLAELHGGSVGVESTPDKGSRFYFDLPWVPVEQAITSTEASEQTQVVTPQVKPTGAGKLILLAEDNLVNQQGLSNYLLARGYRVVLAQNGAEAIERASEFTPDLILMDIQMPVLEGLEAIHRLRAQPKFAITPIIALTALVMPGDRERCLKAGATEYLAKPVGLKALVQVMETLYESAGGQL